MSPAEKKVESTRCPRVFVVDDDPAIRSVICAILSDAGYACESFLSAQAFLDALDISAAGCILLDIRMPNMSGPELQAILIERGCRLPIIFLSAEADVRTAVNVLQRGAVDLIEKPSEPRILVDAVRRAIARDAEQRVEMSEMDDLRKRKAEMTPREIEVADLLATGNSNRQTALALGLSERTVEIHRARIMTKMRCDSIVNFGVQWLRLQSAVKQTENRDISNS